MVDALNDLVHDGWKCDNGFRSGFLANLKKSTAHRFPGTGLKGEPHIQSKIHVGKKNLQYIDYHTIAFRIQME